MKKAIFTLNIDDYNPRVTALTYPYIKKYADKIGAEFKIISEIKFPGFPTTYEKLQIYELGKEYDWVIFIDSDALIHPDMFDVTEFISKDTVLQTGNDIANYTFKYDNNFKRDGRHIGACNWFTVSSDWCIDLWKPLDDMLVAEAIGNIRPVQVELNAGNKKEHYIDDYVLSRNIAKYGLKYKTLGSLFKEQGNGQSVINYFAHNHTMTPDRKVEFLKATIDAWKI